LPDHLSLRRGVDPERACVIHHKHDRRVNDGRAGWYLMLNYRVDTLPPHLPPWRDF